MYHIEDILNFLDEEAACSNPQPASDLVHDLGIWGDDFHGTISAFAERFSVDMSNYLWYFHTFEEGFNFPGGLVCKPPNDRVKRIPVTPKMLLDFANAGKWDMTYPPHELPRYRWDRLINWIFWLSIIMVGIWTCV